MPEYFEVRGLDEVLRSLNGAAKYVPEELEEATQNISDAARPLLATYPTPRPGSRYRRTGRLGRGWLGAQARLISSTRSIVGFRLVNSTPYTKWVQGDETQMWAHRGRWVRVGDVAMRLAGRIRGELERAARRVVHRMTSE